jgi:hypothetical protein
MNPIPKRLLRAALCRARESEATGLAEASLLTNVREKHEVAAARWRTLAELDEREGETRSGPSLQTFEDAPCIA